MKIGLITSTLVMIATPALSTPCNIEHSIYRDIENKGFELVFGPRIPALGGSFGTAIISNSFHYIEYNFSLTQSNGYGSIYLMKISPKNQGIELENSFGVYFFDQNLRDATPVDFGREKQAPTYAFISEIGRYDAFQRTLPRNLETNAPLLMDMMWVFERCKSPD